MTGSEGLCLAIGCATGMVATLVAMLMREQRRRHLEATEYFRLRNPDRPLWQETIIPISGHAGSDGPHRN